MTLMPRGTVRCEVEDGVATVTLDRPETLNSMSASLMFDIRSALEHAEADSGVRVLVLTGEGRGFCSGADLSGAKPVNAEPGADPAEAGEAAVSGMDAWFHPAIRALKHCSLPTIARINGVAAGGGLGLAMCCDVAIAARSAFFVATFGPRLGIVPDLGTTWSLPARAGRARALGIALLGDRFGADQAVEWGLVWKAVDDDQLDAEVARVADVLKRSSPEAVTRTRSAIDGAARRTFDEQLDVERDHQKVLIPMNMAEGAAAFMEKREPDFDGR
jgi:2-(1,2-epoxy-1,2-dihydrophenyl)acetyl-CoA isomerase